LHLVAAEAVTGNDLELTLPAPRLIRAETHRRRALNPAELDRSGKCPNLAGLDGGDKIGSPLAPEAVENVSAAGALKSRFLSHGAETT
jgi:hypothetical protein